MTKILNDTTRNIYLANCLYDCIEDNNIRAVQKLLYENKANANIIIPDKGITPFHFAVGSGDENTAEEITKLFLGYGGDPNVRSLENLTPVHIAAAWGRLKVLILLLKCGGDPNLTDEEGKTALDYAKMENYSFIVDYLQFFFQETANKSKNNGYNENNINSKLNCSNKTVEKNLNISINSKDKNVDEENSILYLSSDESNTNKVYSRESGILTIPDTSVENENILNNCVIINKTYEISENIQGSTTEYLTCESVNSFEKNIANSLLTLDLTNRSNYNKILNITSDKSIEILDISTKNNNRGQFLGEEKEASLISVEEEYKHVDDEEGIVLIEKRILVNQKIDDNKSIISTISTGYDTETLRHELTSRGEPPGPITTTTKRIYLRKLKKLQKDTIFQPAKENENNKVYSVELEKTLRNPHWTNDLTSYQALESVVTNQFTKPEPSKKWREGVTKASFTYLLLDPRITLNLPHKSTDLTQEEIWRTFLSAIFYVGKGKRSRPYSHLYQAVKFWKNGENFHNNKKITYILDIWKNNFGVVCLHIFQNVIPVEAYTREATMISALKLQNLCNSKLGNCYGVCATWPERKKRLLGVFLLYRAMLIFLNEGERQLMPDDIGK